MSDKILRALMQLFAIVANTDEVGVKGREIVERFLRRQLPSNFINNYLLIYDEFLSKLKGSSIEGREKKRTSVNSVKVLRICNDINKELEQKQKIIVLIRLFEFVNTAIESVVDQHIEFLNTVSDTFGLSTVDRENCLLLVKGLDGVRDIHGDHFLVIDNQPTLTSHCRHVERDTLSGRLVFLTFQDPFLIVFNYSGTDSIALDGREIIPNSVHVFEPGSVIRGPKLSPIYYNNIIHNFNGNSNSQEINFEVVDLGFTFKKKKIGLYDLNFSTSSKNLVGIMGNSGAGKTTLLNLLNGSVKPSKGKILINGEELYSNSKKLPGLIGNIPQDDLLIEELTVFQNLFYSSKLFFGNLSDEEITEKVNRCLHSLMLFESKDLLVGDPLNKYISGGQRKRLNIALELIREPDILFVDEPTSGLSSNDAENVMDLLKQLTLSGKLIFVVIHQPSSQIFKLFDHLLLLDIGGYPVYFGNPVDSLSYFRNQMSFVDFEYSECPECGNINPEEIFRIVESKTVDEFGKTTSHRKIHSEEWYKLYNANFVSKNKTKEQNIPPTGSRLTVSVSKPMVQFLVYFKRNFFSKINNLQYVAITLFEGPILALILAVALRTHDEGKDYLFGTNPNIPVYIFISTIVVLFLGLITSAEEIIQDKKILKRESFLQLSRNSYLLSKIIFLFIVSASQTFLYIVIGNMILDFNGSQWPYFLVLFSVSCFGNLLGLNISSGMKTRVAVYILIPFLIIPQIMLSGVMVKFDDLNPLVSNQSGAPLIGNVMATRWAYEGLAVNEFKNNPYEAAYFDVDKKLNNANYRKNFWLPIIENEVSKVSEILANGNNTNDAITSSNYFLKNEFGSFQKEYPEIKLTNENKIGSLNNFQHFNELMNANIDTIKQYFTREYTVAGSSKDQITAMLIKKLGSTENYLHFKHEFSNAKLEDFVLNTNEVKSQVMKIDNKVIRRFKPVFINSLENSFFSAPYYSYKKTFLGMSLDTIWYNVIIIWLMTITLYFALYLDILRKLLEK